MENLEIDEYVLKAFYLLKSKFCDMPKSGLLAGGALANTINKLKYPDSKCIINDIDVFVLESEYVDDIRKFNSSERIYNTTNNMNICDKYYESYNTILSKREASKVIKINSSERNGIFNIVRYDINKYDPMFLLETFDINCCAVAIDIETLEIYYTQDFKEYIETKELKVVRPNSPSHTCLRLLKKRDELNATLDIKEEFRFLQLANDYHILGDVRYFFAAQKYLDIYNKYDSIVSEYFTLVAKENKTYTSYRLLPKRINHDIIDVYSNQGVREVSIQGINFNIFNNKISISDFTYFYRNILKNKQYRNIWKDLSHFYKHNNYLENYNNENYKIVVDYLEKYNATKLSLLGMTLKEQIDCLSILKKFFNNDEKAEMVLNFYPNSLKHLYKNEEELALEMRIYQIKYRGEIFKHTKKFDYETDLKF